MKKDDKSHQEVYYYIPKRRQKKVIDGISKRFLYKKVDEFWERFSLEQKKRAVKEMAYSQSMIMRVQRNFFRELLSIFSDWANDRTVELNNPLQGNMSKYSTKERAELNNILAKLKNDCTKIGSNLTAEEKFIADNLNALMELSLEFQNYVVDPIYEGNGYKAIQDLMRKAVEEQKRRTEKAIIDFFELTTEHFSSYGQVYVVINDYRGRIEYLKLVFSKAKPILDLPELIRENVVIKAFAQSGSRRVALKDIYPQNDDVEIDIGFNPESLYVALLSKDDNVKLDGKEFGTWRGEKGIIIERPKEEILFLTRAGESQTLEYKGDMVDENNKNDFIETIVAFSNTNRGVILVGVSDSDEMLGTEKKAEDFERLIHDCCDPPPNNVKVEEADMPDKKHIIIVEVPLGENRPYQSKRDKNFYVRHNANDMRMERSELISILEEINRERDQF